MSKIALYPVAAQASGAKTIITILPPHRENGHARGVKNRVHCFLRLLSYPATKRSAPRGALLIGFMAYIVYDLL